MGFLDFFKSKPKAEIEILANDFVKKVESGTEAEAKRTATELVAKIKAQPTIIMEGDDYSVVGKALFYYSVYGYWWICSVKNSNC